MSSGLRAKVRAGLLGLLGGERLPDGAFLLAASAVVDTPASPVKTAVLLTICGIFGAAVTIMCVARVDVYAVAVGRVQSVGRSKVVQPLDAGVVQRIYVRNGTYVHRGALLLELDSTEPTAERQRNAHQVIEYRAEIARRRTAVAMSSETVVGRVAKIAFDAGVDPNVRDREEVVLMADLGELRANLQSLDAKISQSEVEKASLRTTIDSEQQLLATLRERVSMREALSKEQWETRANVLDANETLAREIESLAENQGKLLQDDAAIASLVRQKQETITKFVADNSQAMSEVAAKLDDVAQDLVKSQAKAARTRMTAPIDGTIQELALTTIGQVAMSGQQLMIIVPDRTPVEIEALVLNRDIGFVTAGQTAVVKVDSFPYTIYGSLRGNVRTVSRDAVDVGSREKALPSADAAAQPITGDKSDATGTEQTQDLVFPVTVALNDTLIRKGRKSYPLSSGMTVTVEIKTGERRLIEYLLTPFFRTVAEAGHER